MLSNHVHYFRVFFRQLIIIKKNLLFFSRITEMKVVDYTNSTKIISQHPKMCAINSCIEVDLTGQVVSDSIGTRMFSGKYL